jgi:hypothetical protein
MIILLLCVAASIALLAAVIFYELWRAADRAENYHAE